MRTFSPGYRRRPSTTNSTSGLRTSTLHASPMFTRTSLARERTRLICRAPLSREI